MEIKIIPNELEQQFREIRRRIHRLQSGGTLDSLHSIGADTRHQIGASYVSLKDLASRYEACEPLALLLWDTQKREEQIIACLLFPLETNKEKITQLLQTCLNFEIAAYLGSLYLYRHPELPALASAWQDSKLPFQQTALLSALARHLLIYKKDSQIPHSLFHALVQRNYKEKYVQLMAERYRFNI